MSSLTTNYGFENPISTEAADVNVLNNNLDLLDTTLKSMADQVGYNSYPMTKWRIAQSFTIGANNSFTPIVQSTAPLSLWEEMWTVEGTGPLEGAIGFQASGYFQLYHAGIYKVSYSLTTFTEPTLPEGNFASKILGNSDIPGSYIRSPMATGNGVPGNPLKYQTNRATFFIKIPTDGTQPDGTYLGGQLRLMAMTSAGSVYINHPETYLDMFPMDCWISVEFVKEIS